MLYLIINSDEVLSRKIIKKVWIYKKFGHEALINFEPISFIKEAILPFGKLSVEHSIEKRDLKDHKLIRKVREAEDIVFPNIESAPDAVIETQKKIINTNNLLTDIILTRVEFHQGKPVDAIKLHSITYPDDTDGAKEGGILSATSIDTNTDLEAQAFSKESTIESEPVPLKITEETKIEDGDASLFSSEKLIEPKSDVEIISKIEEKANSDEEKKSTEDVKSKSQLEILETTDDKANEAPLVEKSEGTIDNREVETKESEAISENVELVSAKAEPIVEVMLPPTPAEIPAIAVSPLPQPVYIPLYTDVKIPEVISAAPPVVVVTEKEIVVAPPPAQTETIIQTEQTPGLFTRGSRFMLNVSSRILKKLLRLLSRVQSRLPAPPPVEA